MTGGLHSCTGAAQGKDSVRLSARRSEEQKSPVRGIALAKCSSPDNPGRACGQEAIFAQAASNTAKVRAANRIQFLNRAIRPNATGQLAI